MNMKKNICLMILAAGLFSLTGCKSSANAYKTAYEKAVQNDQVQAEQPAAQPVQDENVSVRQEKVTKVSGEGEILQYAVVCGSYSLKANADALLESLKKDGYSPVVAVNEAGKTYRVILASFKTKEEASDARAKFKAQYPDNTDFQGSWILYNK